MPKLIFLFLLIVNSVYADENIRPTHEFLREGYTPWAYSESQAWTDLVPAAHSLPWPVNFENPEHSLGNSMAQFQPFDNPPYFHGGCDLRTQAGEKIISPVGGKLEAGHYGYSTNPDGSMKKFWKPWPQKGDATYFEVAVVDANGVRFEYHHINRATLPSEIVNLLNGPNPEVQAGTYLGDVIRWKANGYHHVHYNVILPGGERVNPEYVSTLIDDNIGPEMRSVFVITQDGKTMELNEGDSVTNAKEFVVRTLDYQNTNSYVHPPSYAAIKFDSGEKFEWDFRKTLTRADGSFPPLWDFFLSSISDPRGGRHRTEGGYGTGQSLIRLTRPAGAVGDFTIEISDIAGNTTRRAGRHL